MASIKDIARAAGISTSAVSKALNGYSDISQATREHVLKIAEELNYSPSIIARSLASQKPLTLGLIFSDVKETDSNGNIIFRLFISSIHHCQEFGYEMLVVHTDPAQQKKKTLKDLCTERRLGGAVLYGFKLSDPYIVQLRELDIPFVLIDMFLQEKNTAAITIDNESAILEMLKHIVNYNKHNNIVFVNGLADSDIANIRLNSYIKARKQLELDTKDFLVCNADFLEEKAYDMTRCLINEHSDISCFFCVSDIMAMGVMRALREAGKRIPDDIGVSGFDGIQISDYVTPSLTTIRQDFKRIGQLASQTLIDMVEHRKTDKVVLAPYSIKIGQSV